MDECSSLSNWLVLFLFAVVSRDTFILLVGHAFRITLSFDALVSKNTSLVGLLVFKT